MLCNFTRAVDPYSFYTAPDPAVFLNADPDPGQGPAERNLKRKKIMKSFQVAKNIKDC